MQMRMDQRHIVTFKVITFMLLQLMFINPTLEQVEILSSAIERQALLQLRSSLGLRSKEWPRKQDPCLVWIGIQCENGSVTGINISGFRRTRLGSQNPQFAVDSLANLTSLRSFNASRFLLPGSIPDWFGQKLVSLQVLDLQSCAVSNSVPESLGNLSTLTALYLSNNKLTDRIPSSLGRLTRLLILDLSMNLLTGSIPVSFAGLGNLTRLDISSNFLSGPIPSGIGMLARLQYLNISSNSLSSSIPASLGNLSNLVNIDLSNNSLSGSVPVELGGLRNLKRTLIGNNFLGGSLPVTFFSIQSRLQIVDLKQNNFNGRIPDAFWSLPALLFADISGNNFTGELNVSVNSNTPIALVNISDNLFYGGLGPILRRFGSVDLSGNYFEGKVPDYVTDNASLIRNCLQNKSNQRSLSDCATFYAERGLTFDNFGNELSEKSHKRVIILESVMAGVGLIVLLLLPPILICLCRRGAANRKGIRNGPVPSSSSPKPAVASTNTSSSGESFLYPQLLLATNEFSDMNLIKHGHSGDLYRGHLKNGISVVVKKVDLQRSLESYTSELEFFKKVSHPRLVPFFGHCLENEQEKFLVYKYMPNGDLASCLYRKASVEDNGLQSLDWITRLKIAIGAAEGLSYLHHDCTPPILHGDVQASSILLDDRFEVRLGSLSEASAQDADPHRSKITRLLRWPKSSEHRASASVAATCAYDVYCFGKVLLELVTGKSEISALSDAQLKERLEQMLPYISVNDKTLVTKIVDPSLIIDEDLFAEVWSVAIVAKSCLNPKPSRRPLMQHVLKALENPLKVIREEHNGSARLRTSSRESWIATLFGSWRSSSDVLDVPGGFGNKPVGASSFRNSGTSNSQASGRNSGSGNCSFSRRRHSNEIFPEPSDVQDLERRDQD